MTRRRYCIEAHNATLLRFVQVVENCGRGGRFIERVTSSSTDEYYYVVLIAEGEVHAALWEANFKDSILRPL